MTEVNRYRIYCTTETTDVYTWGTTTPTTCPNNDSHIINSNTVTIIQSVSNRKVKIEEEDPDVLEPTNGRFRAQGFSIDSTSEIEEFSFSWQYPISALNIKFIASNFHVKDTIECNIDPVSFLAYVDEAQSMGANTLKLDATNISTAVVNDDIYLIYPEDSYTQSLGKITSIDLGTRIITFSGILERNAEKHYCVSKRKKVGYLTANKQIGDVILSINPELTNLIQRGIYVTISNNTYTQNLGEVLEIDAENNQIRIQNPLEYNFNQFSYLYVTVKTLKNFKIDSDKEYTIGNSKIGGSYVTKFYIVSIRYIRPPNLQDYPSVKFNWCVEYLY